MIQLLRPSLPEMDLVRLTLRRIEGSPFRSALVFLCVALVAGLTVWATLIIQGAEENLRLSVSGMENRGVDIVVVPRKTGFTSTGVGNVNLVGLLSSITAISGVDNASPQLLLSTLSESKYCTEPEMFLVAFDPATDFSVMTWMQEGPVSRIGIGEAIAGSLVSSPDGEHEVNLVGYKLRLVGHLSPTGTSLDQSLYVTFETTQEMARQYPTLGNGNSVIATNNVPYILVNVESEIDPHKVASLILRNIPGVTVFDNTDFFHMTHDQMKSMVKNIPGLLGIGWSLAVVCIGLVFSIAVNERRREIGVLRALGFPRVFIFRSLLAEGFILALDGAAVGTVLSILAVIFIKDEIIRSTGLLFASFSPFALLLLVLESLGLALSSVFLATIFPAWRISRQDPAVIMRR